MSYDVAVIGTGAEPDDPGGDGYAMAYHHANAYEKLDAADLVACADIVPENAEAFAVEYGIDDGGIYEDYETMLNEVEPEVVSVCVPPSIHAPICIDCARAASVEGIHCEKPMAETYGGARQMTQEAARHDVQLTFNHQRRFSDVVRTAKQLLDDGEIGNLERVEFSAGVGIFDYGSHSFDLCNYFNDEVPGEWVMGQIDYREENVLFGSHNENQALVIWQYENGVHGLAGTDSTGQGGLAEAIACHNRLVGSEGVIEVGPDGDDAPPLRIRRDGDDEWEHVETEDGMHDWAFVDRAIAENIRCLSEDEKPELRAENALNATELIFATWESSRRRGRVDLPLDVEDNPLVEMVESGELNPRQTEE
jgi:predicted dehydrogenase